MFQIFFSSVINDGVAPSRSPRWWSFFYLVPYFSLAKAKIDASYRSTTAGNETREIQNTTIDASLSQ